MSCDMKASLKTRLREFDYVRFTLADLNGVPRGKLVPTHSVDQFIDNGLGGYGGMLSFSSCNTIPVKTIDKELCQHGHPSMVMFPDPTSLHSLPWVKPGGASKVAQLLCTSHWLDGTPQRQCPRFVALEALRKLDEMGLELKSGFEVEFKAYEKEGRKPLFQGTDFCVLTTLAEHEDYLMDLERNLLGAGIMVETIHPEYSFGQFELSLKAEPGIKGVDDFFVLRNSVKEMSNKRGYLASFMAKPDMNGCGSGAHFNFSIWDKKTGKNVMYDASKEDGLSDFMRHFIAGMSKHSSALLALCCPTVNCYRRLHQPWAPNVADWGIQDRMASYRVKNAGESGTYFENRLPSGSANPYLVLAGTLAAGLDGVERKLPCPKARNPEDPKLPFTLAEALDALDKDADMRKSIGDECINWFVGMKREIDLEKLKDSDMTQVVEAHIEAERNQYEKLC